MSDHGTIHPVSQQMSILSDRDKYGQENNNNKIKGKMEIQTLGRQITITRTQFSSQKK
jgi:hypothetical protein